jgi:hypothetical protein
MNSNRFPHDGFPLVDGGTMYPNNGLPPRPGENRPALSAWARMLRGWSPGKRVNLAYDEANPHEQSAKVSILDVRGDDMDAQQLTLTLLPPQVVPMAFTSQLIRQDLQNISGSQDNIQFAQTARTFPGTLPPGPIVWPPFVAKIQWGIGGVEANKVEVDFTNGTTINLCASSIRVDAAVPANTGFVGTSAVYTLGAFVGPGYPRPGNAQLTQYTGIVDPSAESLVLPVPRVAHSATVVGMDPTDTPGTQVTVANLRFWQSPNRTNNVGNYTITGDQPGPFRFPSAATYATVASLMPLPTRFAIIYNLAI